MARCEIVGVDEYLKVLNNVLDDISEIQNEAIYEAANIVANEVKQQIKNIPTEKQRKGTSEKPMNVITKNQKEDLLNSFGIAPISNNEGFKNVKLGFDGYGALPTKKYPKGVPNMLLARSVEIGTSFRKKHPFMRKAVNKTKKMAILKMDEIFSKHLKKKGV